MSITAWSWQDRAECKDTDPDATVFFGLDGERGPAREAREARAKAICQECAVRLQCGNYAIRNGEKHGTWGGMSEDERAAERRRRMRRERGRAA